MQCSECSKKPFVAFPSKVDILALIFRILEALEILISFVMLNSWAISFAEFEYSVNPRTVD